MGEHALQGVRRYGIRANIQQLGDMLWLQHTSASQWPSRHRRSHLAAPTIGLLCLDSIVQGQSTDISSSQLKR